MHLLLTFVGLISSKEIQPDSDGTYRIRYNHTADFFNWIVLGDWGGWPAPLYTRLGISIVYCSHLAKIFELMSEVTTEVSSFAKLIN